MGEHKGVSGSACQCTDNGHLLRGDWHCFDEGIGLSMHCGDFEELSDVSHSLELPAGLSLSVIFGGQVAFSIAGQKYALGERYQPVECACFALGRPDVLTRHMHRGSRVCKVNVFVEKDWLLARCSRGLLLQQWQGLFSHHGELQRWRPHQQIVQLCRQLLDRRGEPSLEAVLTQEANILALVGGILGQWQNQLHAQAAAPAGRSIDPLAESVKTYIDGEPLHALTLEHIARAHHSSVSTIQRRFKRYYGMTVNGYLRLQRLERAKRALLVEGLSIGEAAYLAGYSHAANFIAAFTKAYAMSPAAYRERHSR